MRMMMMMMMMMMMKMMLMLMMITRMMRSSRRRTIVRSLWCRLLMMVGIDIYYIYIYTIGMIMINESVHFCVLRLEKLHQRTCTMSPVECVTITIRPYLFDRRQASRTAQPWVWYRYWHMSWEKEARKEGQCTFRCPLTGSTDLTGALPYTNLDKFEFNIPSFHMAIQESGFQQDFLPPTLPQRQGLIFKMVLQDQEIITTGSEVDKLGFGIKT